MRDLRKLNNQLFRRYPALDDIQGLLDAVKTLAVHDLWRRSDLVHSPCQCIGQVSPKCSRQCLGKCLGANAGAKGELGLYAFGNIAGRNRIRGRDEELRHVRYSDSDRSVAYPLLTFCLDAAAT